MENWGCVTYGDGQLFRTPPTHQQRQVRAEFVFHEMAHMWFGDLVTMRWWDDLWLNEAFASWAANWGLANASEFTEIWASFLALFKRTAYEMDMGPAAHPIRGEVHDVSQAMANFDAITYVKGQGVLHQLAAFIGEDAFVAGLQTYFARHSWGNTVLSDLMTAFGEAAGRDLGDWTARLAGPGRHRRALPRGRRAHRHLPGRRAAASAPRRHRVVRRGGRRRSRPPAPPRSSSRRPRPRSTYPQGDLRLVNAGDLTFAAVRPDEQSRRLMFEHIADLPDPLSRALVVGTASQLLLLGELAPRVAAGARDARAGHRDQPGPGRGVPGDGHAVRRPLGAPGRGAGAAGGLRRRGDGARGRPTCTASRRCARWPARRPPTAHWRVLDEAAAASGDNDLAWRIATRGAAARRLRRRRGRSACSTPTPTRTPTPAGSPCWPPARTWSPSRRSGTRSSSTTASRPAGRRSCWAPRSGVRGRASCSRRSPCATSRSCAPSRAACSTRASSSGRCTRSGVGDETFLAAAEAASDDESLSAYARNQLTVQRLRAGADPAARRSDLASDAVGPLGSGDLVVGVDAAQPRRWGTAARCCRSIAAPTSPAKSGCGRVGRERSSGCACVAT